MGMNRAGIAAFVITFFEFMAPAPAHAGVKTKWTIDVHNLDRAPSPSQETLLYAKGFTISVLENGTHIGFGGGYNPLSPLAPSTEPTGDFRFKLKSLSGSEATYFLAVYDRTSSPPRGFNAMFETEARMRSSDVQRVYFTQGDFASGRASRYLLFIRLNALEPCDDYSTCFVE